MMNITGITPYPDVNDVLLHLTNDIESTLDKNLIGLYLFGSLSYGDFNIGSSDIDLVAILHRSLDQAEIVKVKALHNKIAVSYPTWRERIECSYLPIALLSQILPPKEPRPYYGGNVFYEEADYGNEWIINNYLMYEHSIPLIGVSIKDLMKPVAINEVQQACIRDLFKEWVPKINDPEWLSNSHYQSYIVINLCRILYTVTCGRAGSKREAAGWVKLKYGAKWHNLIETAQNWEYGKTMSLQDDVIAFIQFIIDETAKSSIYSQVRKP